MADPMAESQVEKVEIPMVEIRLISALYPTGARGHFEETAKPTLEIALTAEEFDVVLGLVWSLVEQRRC